MKTKKVLFRLLAVVVCLGLWIGYGCFCAFMEFKHGGGTLLLVILCSLMVAVWKGFNKLADKTTKTKEESVANKTEEIKTTTTVSNQEAPVSETKKSENTEDELPPIPSEKE